MHISQCSSEKPSTMFTWVRDFPVGHNLVEQNPKGPHVWFDGEGAVVNGLWSSPLNGEFGSCRMHNESYTNIFKFCCRCSFSVSHCILYSGHNVWGQQTPEPKIAFVTEIFWKLLNWILHSRNMSSKMVLLRTIYFTSSDRKSSSKIYFKHSNMVFFRLHVSGIPDYMNISTDLPRNLYYQELKLI